METRHRRRRHSHARLIYHGDTATHPRADSHKALVQNEFHYRSLRRIGAKSPAFRVCMLCAMSRILHVADRQQNLLPRAGNKVAVPLYVNTALAALQAEYTRGEQQTSLGGKHCDRQRTPRSAPPRTPLPPSATPRPAQPCLHLPLGLAKYLSCFLKVRSVILNV